MAYFTSAGTNNSRRRPPSKPERPSTPGGVLTTRSVHKDGRALYVDLGFALLRDRSGNVPGALATAHDATERYLEHKALRERLRQLEAKLSPPS
jgi:hypothetical protein